MTFDDFEAGAFSSDWSQLNSKFNVTSDAAFSGTYAASVQDASGGNFNTQLMGRWQPSDLAGGAQPDRIAFYWREQSGSHGGGIRLRSSDGAPFAGLAANNPEWVYTTGGDSGSQFYDGGGSYGHWILFEFLFDWSDSQITFRGTRQDTGETYSETASFNATDIAGLAVHNYEGTWGSGTSDNDQMVMWFDDVRVDPVPPTISASASSGDVTITIDGGPHFESGYHIYRATSSGATTGDYSHVGTAAAGADAWTDTDAPEGKTLYYRVASYDGKGESDLSNEATATTSLPAPSNVELSIDSPTTGTVTWTDNSSDESNFRVVVFEDGEWSSRTDPGANTTSETVSFAKATDNVQVRVAAETSDVLSDWTYSETHATDGSGLSGTAVSGDQIDLSWSAKPDADAYRLFRARSSSDSLADYTHFETVAAGITTFEDTGRTDGTTYHYRVAPVYGGVSDDPSANVAVTTALPAPSIVSLDTATENEVTVEYALSDDSPDGVLELYRSTDGSLGTRIATISDLTNGTYTDTGRADGERYYYTARRVTDHATADSDQVPATTVLPAPTDFDVSNVTGTTADYAWTSNHDYGETRVEYRPTTPDGEPDESWQEYTAVGHEIESVTVDGLRTGEEYEARVVAVTEHTETEDA